MKRNRVIALLVIIFGISTLFGQAAFAARTDTKAAGKSTHAAREKAKAGKGKAAKALNLTADQKAKIKAIQTDAKAKAKTVSDDTSLAPDAKKAKLKEIRKAAQAQIMQVLTPKQQKTWNKIHKKAKASLAKRLGLTADQKAKIKSILAASKAEAKAVRDDKALTKEAKKAKLKEIHAAALAKVREVLTPEQRTKLDAAPAGKTKKKA